MIDWLTLKLDKKLLREQVHLLEDEIRTLKEHEKAQEMVIDELKDHVRALTEYVHTLEAQVYNVHDR